MERKEKCVGTDTTEQGQAQLRGASGWQSARTESGGRAAESVHRAAGPAQPIRRGWNPLCATEQQAAQLQKTWPAAEGTGWTLAQYTIRQSQPPVKPSAVSSDGRSRPQTRKGENHHHSTLRRTRTIYFLNKKTNRELRIVSYEKKQQPPKTDLG